MSIYDDLTRAIKEHGEQFQPKPIRQRGQLGYTVNNVYSVPEPSDTAQYRVRLDNKSFITAYHDGKCAPQPDLSVWVIQDELGRYHIDSVDVTNVSSSNPNNPSQAFTAPHSHGRGSGMEFPIDPRLLSPFQIRVVSGLNVYVNGGAYKYEGKWKWFGGDTIDLSSYVPVTANQQRWAILTLDHPTATITVISGTVQSIASPLTLEQIESETLKGIPVGAVRLRNGQTGIVETDMESLHILVDSYPKHNYSAIVPPTANDDEDDGYGISSEWYDQVGQLPYVCIDATAGAAVWVSGGGGGGSSVTSTTSELNAWEIIETQVLVANGVFDFQNIPQTYDDLEVYYFLRGTVSATSDIVYMYFNNDTTLTNYRAQDLASANATTTSSQGDNSFIGVHSASTATADYYGFGTTLIPDYTSSMSKQAMTTSGFRGAATTHRVDFSMFFWESTSAITRVQIRPDGYATDNFLTGSYAILRGRRNITVVTSVSGGGGEPTYPITIDTAKTIDTNNQIVLSHINIIAGGSLDVNGVVVYVGEE